MVANLAGVIGQLEFAAMIVGCVLGVEIRLERHLRVDDHLLAVGEGDHQVGPHAGARVVAAAGLLEYGFDRDVVIATPSTLLALLRTVAYSWRQERLARDADQVLEVGRRLHARLGTLSGHLTKLGAALGTTMARFNDTVGSYEHSVLTAARRFDDLGVAASPVPTPEPLEATVRTLRPAELPRLDVPEYGVPEDDESRDGTHG